MDPFTIAVIGAVATQGLGAIAQYYQGEKARGAAKGELAKIRDLFERIAPPNLNVSIEDPPAVINERVPPGQYDYSRLTPEEYRVVSQVNPQGVAFAAPPEAQQVKETAAGRQGLEAQRQALQQLQARAASGRNPEVEEVLNKGARRAGQESRARAAELEQDFARRGMLNSGIRAAAQLRGNSDAMANQGAAAERAASLGYRAQLEAMQAAAAAGHGLRGQDLDLQSQNANILNQLNQTTTKQRQDLAYQNAQNALNAQIMNSQMANQVANRNVDLHNQYNVENRNYRNTMKGKEREEDIAERKRLLEAWQGKLQGREFENTARMNAYDAQLRHAAGQMGFYQAGNEGRAAQANATQGAVGGISSAFKGAADYQSANQRESNANKRTNFAYTGRWKDPDEEE